MAVKEKPAEKAVKKNRGEIEKDDQLEAAIKLIKTMNASKAENG